MIYNPHFQQSFAYIDSHLLEDIRLEEVALCSGYSLSHFYKLFPAVTGFTVKEYIRNKRLSQAARELVKTRRKVVDIAMDYHFESHEVFTRAFTTLYGLVPSSYRKQRTDILLYDQMDAFARWMEDRTPRPGEQVPIQARIVEWPETSLIGMEILTSVAENIDTQCIPRFWQEVFIPRISEIRGALNPHETICFEISDPQQDSLYHLACLAVENMQAPSGMVLRVLPARRYAVFTPQRFWTLMNIHPSCVLLLENGFHIRAGIFRRVQHGCDAFGRFHGGIFAFER